jgi:glycosyltransferase involved in cell wall biosynthesis
LRICYIADAGSIHVQRWVSYFAGKGHQVHIITSRLGEGYPESVRLHLLTSLLPQRWKRTGYINTLPWFIQARRLVNRIKPDIIDAHYVTINGYLGAFSGFHPLVLTALGSDVLTDPGKGFYLRFLAKYALKKAEMVTCNSETVRRELVKLGVSPDRISIIYQGIDTQKFSPRQDRGFKDKLGLRGRPVIISLRSFKPVYNVEMLVRAAPLVLEHFPQAIFVVAGEGEQREYLMNLAGSLGCSENIRFVGRIAHDELPQYLASSEVYVSTSLSDSASLTLQEAMACELAPVVTDLSGNREWITDGENGFLVPVNDVQALANKIVHLLENEGVAGKFGKLGRKIVQERAEYEREMERVEELYQRVVAEGPSQL